MSEYSPLELDDIIQPFDQANTLLGGWTDIQDTSYSHLIGKTLRGSLFVEQIKSFRRPITKSTPQSTMKTLIVKKSSPVVPKYIAANALDLTNMSEIFTYTQEELEDAARADALPTYVLGERVQIKIEQ
jgi:hypothetical protein